MTEKEKAKEIVDKFKFYPGVNRSKECALIHCQGIIDFCKDKFVQGHLEFIEEQEKIKEEVNNL